MREDNANQISTKPTIDLNRFAEQMTLFSGWVKSPLISPDDLRWLFELHGAMIT
jgi:hypothetical protein